MVRTVRIAQQSAAGYLDRRHFIPRKAGGKVAFDFDEEALAYISCPETMSLLQEFCSRRAGDGNGDADRFARHSTSAAAADDETDPTTSS